MNNLDSNCTTNDKTENSSSVIYWANIEKMIHYYSPFFISPLGFIGNILSFCVFTHKGMKESVIVFLLRCLAVFDFFAVSKSVVLMFQYNGIIIQALSQWSCGIWNFIFISNRIASFWTQSVMSVLLVCIFHINSKRCLHIKRPKYLYLLLLL